MVISLNPEPNKEVFQSLLDETLITLDYESKRNEKEYLKHLGNKLEDVVADIMADRAKGTPFENSIKLFSGQRFPDIVANKYYGVEVKSTTKNHWTTTGNSVLEGTRIKGVERIYLLFGKMVTPIEFKCKPYEDCLSEVVVTHSPRYLINMDLVEGQTFFDKLGTSYDTLRKSQNPVRPIVEYYRQFLRPGDDVWWLDQEGSRTTGAVIRLWKNLPIELRREYNLKAMIFFPKVFSNAGDKYERLATWLVNMYGVISPNVRDHFSAGGQGQIEWGNRVYANIPKIIVNLINYLPEIKKLLQETENEVLSHYWEIDIDDKWNNWIDLVIENTKYMKLPFDLEDYLSEKLA